MLMQNFKMSWKKSSLKPKHHNGLQALSAIASSTQSFLGPPQRFKTIVDSDGQNGVIVSSCMELLQALDIQHPVGEIIMSACLTHHKTHGTCVTTLITMAGCWGSAVQGLIDQGVPISVIRSLGDKCLKLCVDTAKEQAIYCNISLPHSNPVTSADSMLQSQRQSEEDPDPKDGVRSDRTVSTSLEELRYNVVDTGLTQKEASEMDGAFNVLEKSFSPEEVLTAKTASVRDHDDDEDVSWYFEGTGGQDFEFDAELEKVRGMFAEFGSKSEKIVPHKMEDDWSESVLSDKYQRKHQKPVSTANLHLKKQTLTVNKDQIVETEEDDGDDFKNYFSDLSSPDNFALKSNLKDVPGEKWNTESKYDDWGEQFETGSFNSDEEFQDCIPDTSPGQATKTVAKSNCLYKTKVSPDDFDGIDVKLQQDVRPGAKETTFPFDGVQINAPPGGRDMNYKLIDLLGQSIGSIGGKRPSTSKKLLNNSRHFKTVESVVEEHADGGEGEVEDAISVQKDVVGGGHPETGSEDVACLEQQLQSLLQKKLATSNKSLHSRVVGQSRHFRTKDQQKVSPFVPNVDKEESLQETENLNSTTSYDVLVEHEVTASNSRNECITDIWTLGAGLSHGADREMRLAVEAYLSQIGAKHKSDQTILKSWFDFDRLFVCCITGPSEAESCVLEGLVLPVKEDQIQNILHHVGNSLNCLLINGDLKPSARHAGYKESIQATRIQHGGAMAAQENGWLMEVTTALNKLQVGLLITKGQVDQDLLDFCNANGIIVLQHTPYKALVTLSGDTDMVTYITDATEEDTLTDVTLTFWECGWQANPVVRKPNLERTHYVVVNSTLHLQTAVISSPTISGRMGAEDRFWRCLHRLSGAIRDGRVLPGAGAVEVASVRQLDKVVSGEKKLHRKEEDEHHTSWAMSVVEEYTPIVAKTIKEGFVQYLAKTLQNSADISSLTDIKCAIEKIVQGNGDDGIISLFSGICHQFNTDRTCHESEHLDIAPDLLTLEGAVPVAKKVCNNSVSKVSATVKCQKSGTRNDQEVITNAHTNTINFNRTVPISTRVIDINDFAADCVYDSYHSKLTAWKCAWEIVKTVLQADCVIVNGIDGASSLL